MTTLEAIVNSTTYPLHDVDGDLVWIGEDGWGMAPTQRLTDRGPLQHGDSDLDFRLHPRLGMLKLLAQASTIAGHWDIRKQLLKIFRPSRTPITLRWTLDNGDVRQIDVHYAGDLTFSSEDRLGYSQKAVVQLRAADPTFYDPTLQTITYGVGGGTGVFAFPLSWPASFGSSTVNQTRTIAYAGTWRTYPVVIIKGPITNPVITNLTTGDKLDLTGTTITTGDSYTIDCRPGVKTVVDASGSNRIDKLSDDSDLATFSLEADGEAALGLNDIKVTGTGANATTEVYLQFHTRYIGI
jgi:hypothetical protein